MPQTPDRSCSYNSIQCLRWFRLITVNRRYYISRKMHDFGRAIALISTFDLTLRSPPRLDIPNGGEDRGEGRGMGGKARKTVEGKGQVKEGPAGAGGSKLYATCNVSSCNNVPLDVRKLRPRIREMNVFCRRPLHFLQGTMQAISRLLLVSLLGLCRIISAEPSSQPFNRLVLPQEEEGGGGREWGGPRGRGGRTCAQKTHVRKVLGCREED